MYKYIITLLLCTSAGVVQAQTFKTCSVAYRVASKVTYDLEAISGNSSLDDEASAYFDAGNVAFLTVNETPGVRVLCSADTLASIARITKDYLAQIAVLREQQTDKPNTSVVDAVEHAIKNHRQ